MELSRYLENYLKDFQADYDYRHQAIVASFEVDDLALQVGKFYEKVRKVIDWKDENALKRGAIARAINRNLIPQVFYLESSCVDQRTLDLAETTVFELMRSGYFDNKLINAAKVEQTAVIMHKYILAFQYLNSGQEALSKKDLKARIRLQNWTVQIMACEIEQLLAPAFKTWAQVDLMEKVLADRIKVVPAGQLDDFTRTKQLRIAVWRSLFEADDYLLSYVLLKMYHPDFVNYQFLADTQVIMQMYDDKRQIDLDLIDPIGHEYLRIANKYDAAYRMIGDITESVHPQTIAQGERFFAEADQTRSRYDEIYADKYNSLKRRLLITAFWTTLSIIVANFASVLLLEWPVARWLGLGFSAWAIAMDIAIPSIAMFLLVICIRPPRAENQNVTWNEIRKIVYAGTNQDTYEIRLKKRSPSKLMQGFFYGSTLMAGALGLYGLYWIFRLAGLPWTSVYLNVVYITMVLFASLNIRSQAQELTVWEKSSLFDFVLDIFSVPLARIGQWFSKKWKEYNIFSIFFSLLIDSPLSNFIGFIEDWRNYIKENKSDIR